MTGYQETITDPSYAGQIVLQTAAAHRQHRCERRRPRVASHLGRRLRRARPLAHGVELAREPLARRGARRRRHRRHLRHRHPRRHSPHPLRGQHARRRLLGRGREPRRRRAAAPRARGAPGMAGRKLSAEVSVSEVEVTPATSERIGNLAVLDLGVKTSTITNSRRAASTCTSSRSRRRSRRSARSNRSRRSTQTVPATRGIRPAVELLRAVLGDGLPFFGICFGNQLLGRALGFGTYKLPFGHRGINQPVLDKTPVASRSPRRTTASPSRRRSMRSSTAPPASDASRSATSASTTKRRGGPARPRHPAFSVQYHPEAASGPHDANYLFDASATW